MLTVFPAEKQEEVSQSKILLAHVFSIEMTTGRVVLFNVHYLLNTDARFVSAAKIEILTSLIDIRCSKKF